MVKFYYGRLIDGEFSFEVMNFFISIVIMFFYEYIDIS